VGTVPCSSQALPAALSQPCLPLAEPVIVLAASALQNLAQGTDESASSHGLEQLINAGTVTALKDLACNPSCSSKVRFHTEAPERVTASSHPSCECETQQNAGWLWLLTCVLQEGATLPVVKKAGAE
jgi:hypothetical protein